MDRLVPNIEVWDKVADTYHIEIEKGEYQIAEEVETLLNAMGIEPGASLIELGSGSGHLSACLAMRGYKTALFDFSPVALEKAKQTYERYGLQGEFIQGDLMGENITEKQYDVAWNSGVMEHFGDIELQKAFRNAANFSIKGILIIVPNPKSISYNLMRARLMSDKRWIYGTEYLRDDYEKILQGIGFATVETTYLLTSEISSAHMYTAVQQASNIDQLYKTLMDRHMLPDSEGYLVAYSAFKEQYKKPENFQKWYTGNTESKTKIFDISSENFGLKTENEKLRNSIDADKKEIQNLSRELSDLKTENYNVIAKLNEIENNHMSLELLNAEKEKEITKLLDDVATGLYENKNLEKKQMELESLLQSEKAQNSQLKKRIQALSEELDTTIQSINRDYTKRITDAIIITQNTRVYKVGLLVRRFVIQCFKTGEMYDFFKYLICKLIHKKGKTRLLKEFDYLENAKELLLTGPALSNSYNSNRENVHTYPKHTRAVVIFASVPFWDVGGGQRSAQLAKTFNSLGYSVHYFYGFPCSEVGIPEMFVPTTTHESIDHIGLDWFKTLLKKDTLVIFEIPYDKFKPYLDIAKKIGCKTVYEHIDNWDSSLGSLFYNKKTFKSFVDEADLITVTAKLLGEKIKELTDHEYLYLPNAVNSEIFEPTKTYQCPNDLKRGKNKTLLYFGSLWGDWFDWDKINYISKKCSDCEINLIGDYSAIMDKANNSNSNIHFLGLKKQTELPAYLAYSDIALLPFKNCDIGKYVSPLKIFEYIAMNKKVLSTPLDDIRNYPNVYCSDSVEEWVEIIKRDDILADSSSFNSQNNWFARCSKLLECCNLSNILPPPISVVVLNYNNKKVIGRCIDTLLSHNKRYGYEIIVVDNGSKDGSYEFLQENYKDRIVLLQNTQNGCSSGRNLGVKHAHGEYLCFLDSDQWVISDYWLDSAIEILVQNIYLGAVSWNAGWFTPGQSIGPIVDYLPNRAVNRADEWFRTDVAYLATSGLLMKTSLFNKIGGFDEFYDPTCFEDTDLSLKIRHEGFDIAYSPYMAIMHLPHQTTNSGSAQHTQLMKRNGDYFMEKWSKLNPILLEYYL